MLEWKQLLSLKRAVGDREARDAELLPERSPFAMDADRIIFSDSFRRLSRKSQVHPLALNDHLHSRLSHSLEVSCVGRSLGCAAGSFLQSRGELPEGFAPSHLGEIVQAACLAHDIGNPPFGHAGEEALREWAQAASNEKYFVGLLPAEMGDFLHFDGNAQGFRVVSRVEMAGLHKGGLQLTWPTLAAMVKYPWGSDHEQARRSHKYNFHQSEADLFAYIFEGLGLGSTTEGFVRHPLSYLTEAADDICYSVIDLEDALELRLISLDDFNRVYADLPRHEGRDAAGRPVTLTRALAIGEMTKRASAAFEAQYTVIMQGGLKGALLDNAPELKALVEPAKELARSKVYSEKRKVALEIGAHSVYETLLDAFMAAVYGKIVQKNTQLSYKQRMALQLLPAVSADEGAYRGYRRVVDYVTGMTDSYATFLAQQFLGAGTGPWQK